LQAQVVHHIESGIGERADRIAGFGVVGIIRSAMSRQIEGNQPKPARQRFGELMLEHFFAAAHAMHENQRQSCTAAVPITDISAGKMHHCARGSHGCTPKSGVHYAPELYRSRFRIRLR